MKRILLGASILLPPVILGLLAFVPQLDATVEAPTVHFYVVTFFTVTAVVGALFITVVLGQDAAPRHRLLAVTFVTMGGIFLVHGILTPGMLIFTFNPGVAWASWLTFLMGSVTFLAAALDRPGRPLPRSVQRLLTFFIALVMLTFALIAFTRPAWLTAAQNAFPDVSGVLLGLTLALWGTALLLLWRSWRRTRAVVDGVMVLIAWWLFVGTISMHRFPLWQLSWWLYHVLLLLSAGTAVYTLSRSYESLRKFRLGSYYVMMGLIATTGLALFTAYLVSRFVEQNIRRELSSLLLQNQVALVEMPDLTATLINARLQGLLIGGVTMGFLFLLLYIVVHRADHLLARRNQELVRAYADLQAAESMRDDLTDMIVHDLRSPLTAINLSLDLLQTTFEQPEQSIHRDRFMGTARNAVGQMLSLINQLLDVARLESGRLQVQQKPLLIGEVLAQKAAVFSPQAEAHQKHITVTTPPNLPVALADADLVDRVLDNLINNALKYTAKGGRISLEAWSSGAALLIAVADDGEGIDQEEAAHIFDKFYQVRDEQGQPRRRGTGLGLTFCRLVVEAHNGRIWVTSQPGQGSTFYFTLPILSPAAANGVSPKSVPLEVSN